MPKIDIAAAPKISGVGYPPPSTASANADGRLVHKDGALYAAS